MSELEILNNGIKIQNNYITHKHSIFSNFVPNSEEIILKNGSNFWIYLNEDAPMRKFVSARQIRFLSSLLKFYIEYSKNKSTKNLRFVASKSYIPFGIIETLYYDYKSNEVCIPETSPTDFIKDFLNLATYNYSNYFSLSFFVFFNSLRNIGNSLDIEKQILKNREIYSKILSFFKILMKKDIVTVSRNLFGDTIIHPLVQNTKTQRNIGIFNGLNYLLPTNKINIVDLVLIYNISSYFKVKDDLIVGRISKRKLKTISEEINTAQINNLLKRIYIPIKDLF